MAGRRTSPT